MAQAAAKPRSPIEYAYCLADFEDGPSLLQGRWISKDIKYAAYPPEADSMTGLEFDKYLQSGPIEPKSDWKMYPIKLRAYSDDFSKVRLKMRKAELNSESDLNTCDESGSSKSGGRGRRSSRIAREKKPIKNNSSDDEDGLQESLKIELPQAPMKRLLTVSEYNKKQISTTDPASAHGRSTPSTSSSMKSPADLPVKSMVQFCDVAKDKAKQCQIRRSVKNEQPPTATFSLPRMGKENAHLISVEALVHTVDELPAEHERSKGTSQSSKVKVTQTKSVQEIIKGQPPLESAQIQETSGSSQQQCEVSVVERPRNVSKVKPVHVKELSFDLITPDDNILLKTNSYDIEKETPFNSLKDKCAQGKPTVHCKVKEVKKAIEPKETNPKINGVDAYASKITEKSSQNNSTLNFTPKVQDVYDENGNVKTSNKSGKGNSDEVTINPSPKQQALSLAQSMSDYDFRAYCILNFSESRTQMKELTKLVAELKIRGGASGSRVPAVPSGSSQEAAENNVDVLDESHNPLLGLPATELAEWKSFDQKLSSDKKFAVAVAMKIKDSCYGNTSLKDYVRAAMRLVMTNSLASEFSWGGSWGKKIAFHNQSFVKVLQWILKKHTKFNREKDDVKKVVEKWLALGSQRFGGANFDKRRSSRNEQEEESADDLVVPDGTNEKKDATQSSKSCKRKVTSTPKKGTKSFGKSPPSKKTRKRNLRTPDDSIDLDDFMAGSKDETEASLIIIQSESYHGNDEGEEASERDEATGEEGDFNDTF